MEEYTCSQCIHYVQHYIKTNTRFRITVCGHCINQKQNGHFRKIDKVCGEFTFRDEKTEKAERIKSATELLAFIARRIDELTEAFEDKEAI